MAQIHVGNKSGAQLMLSVDDHGNLPSRIQFGARILLGWPECKSYEFKILSFT